MPTWLAFLCFERTYTSDALSSPTSTVARAGAGFPSATRALTLARICSKISPASSRPSSTFAATAPLSRVAAERRPCLGLVRSRGRCRRERPVVVLHGVADPGPAGEPEVENCEKHQHHCPGPGAGGQRSDVRRVANLGVRHRQVAPIPA